MTTIEAQRPTRDEVRDLVKECGLDWQRGFAPLFDGDDTNRYEVLVRAAIEQYAAERVAEARKPNVTDYRRLIRDDFEQRMRASGATQTCITRIGSGEYLSPKVHTAWEAEKRKYATPNSKPLTDDQVWADEGIMAANATAGLPMPVLMLLKRAIERAHGIGEQQNG